jgi:hypothetical protein
MIFVKYVVILNGIYDILCAISLLKIVELPLFNKFHLNMYNTPKTDDYKRILAYYIFLNGIIRIFCGLYLQKQVLASIVIASYILEALFITDEMISRKTILVSNGSFVIATSLILAALVFYYK